MPGKMEFRRMQWGSENTLTPGLTTPRHVHMIFQEPVCKSINPSMLAGEKLPDQFFVHMRDILDQEIREAEKAVKEGVSDAGFSCGEMVLEKKIERLTHLKSDIESKCMG